MNPGHSDIKGHKGESRVIWFSGGTGTHHPEQITVTVLVKVRLQRSSVETQEKVALLSDIADLGDVK